jgi:hypothetical protein
MAIFDPLRIDQYRGISAFHTAINDCTDIYDIINFEKMAAKNASSQAGIVKRNNNNASDLSSLTNDEDLNGNTIKLEAIESGKISYLEPGEDIVFPDGPSRPSGAFAEFHKILLRNICLGLGIPYSFAVDPSAMSGPTARLEMQQAGRTFRRYQKLLDDKVLRPIKNIVIADGVARGLIEDNVGSRTTRGIFNFGANVSIDLGRESASAISEFKTGLRTAADIYAERGQDFESAMRQRAIEAKLVKDLAGEYEVSADTISDIAMQGLQRETQVQTAQRPTDQPQGQEGDMDMLGGASLNGAQVASLINVINAVAMGAVSKEGAVSIITAAFPTISPDQARAIIAGVNIGTIIPTTKEEKQQIAKDQGGDASGGSTPQAPEPTTPPTAPAGTSQKKSSLEILESLDPASIKMLIEGMMGGIELAKYDGIDFTPPQGARDAAKRALDVREGKPSSQRGMTPVGIARARDLINGVKLSPDTARRMKAFFDRHEVDKKGATWDEQGKGWQAWNGWGGDAGYAWARKVVGQMEARDKKELAEPASCPIATQDIKTNLANRQTAVDDANYGPANPNEPNDAYWKAKADEFQGDVGTAKKMLCGNCAAFDQRSKVLGCIKKGIGEDANEVAIGGDLGYCEIFDFKCAAKRTCDAWIVGGPITDKKKETEFVAGRDCGQDDGGTFGPDNKCAVGYGRPPLKGGYTPTRPGGKFPKDYKRPTPQDGSKKPLPPKPPLPPPPPPPPSAPTSKAPPPPSKTPSEEKEGRNTSVTKKKAVEKIENNLLKMGLKYVDLPDHIDAAKLIQKEVTDLQKAGYGTPKSLGRGMLMGSSVAWATGRSNYQDVEFNHAKGARYRQITELSNAIILSVKSGHWASPSVVAHEHGHSLHGKIIGKDGFQNIWTWSKLSKEQRTRIRPLAAKVSKYATTDPLEFVAETFAGHVAGKRYSKDIYDAYKELRGPKLKF